MPAAAMALALVSCAPAASAQSLAQRVSAAPEGRVQFSYPARAGACGDGRTFVRLDGNSHFGSYTVHDGQAPACAQGPARVVLERAGRTIVAVHTYVGPPDTTASPVADLGAVPAAEASAYLLGLASTLDGRPSRDAIMPGALAEGVDASDRLLAIARDGARPSETRRSAMSWLAREAGGAAERRSAATALTAIARDGEEQRPVRQHALSVLARLPDGAGVPPVIALVSSADAWLSDESVAALARSGDPRARASLREMVETAALPDQALSVAVRGLAGSYATGDDVALLRRQYARMPGDRSRAAVIGAAAAAGGSENVRWLLGVARDAGAREGIRRTAMSGARRAGATSAELSQLYDAGDNVMRALVVSALAERTDEGAVDKLLAIARSGDDRTLRRRAVAALGRLDDARVKEALAEIVVR